MVKIKDNFSYNQNYYPETNKRKYITIHETANTGVGADADAHANFINNGASETWHYTVDDEKAVCHYYHTTSCWASGTYKGNTESIQIEMCINSDGNYSKTLQNTIELTQKIMKEENISSSHVVQHHYWSGKHCPTLLREGNSGMNWEQFIAGVKGQKVASKEPSKKEVPKGWDGVNKHGTIYKKEKATFIVGNEQIETRIGSPFTSVKSGGFVQPKQKINYDWVCLQDEHVWVQLENNKREQEFIPVRTWNSKTGEVGKAWGEFK